LTIDPGVIRMSKPCARATGTRTVRVLAAVLFAAVVSGCSSSGHMTAASTPSVGGSSASTPATQPRGSVQIVISNFAYQPMDLTVDPGQKVTVVNHDSTAHTLTATSDHAFDTGRIDGGATGSFTAPTTPGSYPYICTIHQFMHGTLTVR
jgi:plastocyanin